MTLLAWGCQRPSLEELSFFEVQTQAASFVNIGTIELRGSISDLPHGTVDACGFWWSSSLAEVQRLGPGANKIALAPIGQGDFSAPLILSNLGETIYFRAYAQLGGRVQLGAVESYGAAEVVSLLGIKPKVSNDSALVWFRLSGLRMAQTNARVDDFGVVVSTDPNPVASAGNALVFALGETARDTVLSLWLQNLSFNTLYHYRAYASVGGRIFHSKTVETIQMKGGWKQIAGFGPYQLGAAAVGGDKAYLGFGYAELGLPTLTETIHRFEASTETWSPGPPYPTANPNERRTEVTSFSIGEVLYFFGGGVLPPGNNGNLGALRDYLKLDTKSGTWGFGEAPPQMPRRLKAVSFVVGDKGYVGGGVNFQNNDTTYLDDFWEYTPSTNQWRPVASLPYRPTDSGTDQKRGRADAIAFSDGRTGYVGGGYFELLYFKDFWRFVPPSSSTDDGHWEFVNYLPGLGREGAVAFSIGERGYFGFGLNPKEGYLKDFWEFKPGEGWEATNQFPGTARTNPLGFSIKRRGYLGTGIQRTWDGFVSKPFLLDDMWRYEPSDF